MLQKICVGMVVAVTISLAASTAMAGSTSVDLDVVLDTGASTWQVFLTVGDSGGLSDGLSGINFDVTADGGDAAITSSSNDLPAPTETTDFASFFGKGFKLFKNDGVNGAGIGAAQDSVSNGDSGTGTGNDAILRGVGLTASSEANGSLGALDIAFPVLAASGGYSGSSGNIVVSGSAASTTLIPASFVDGTTYATFSPSVVNGDSAAIPEPATAALIAVSGIGLMLRRRA